MTIPDEMLEKLVANVLAGGDAAVDGVLAICGRLAMKGIFDRKDIEKVLAIMLNAIRPEDERVAETIERRREELLELAERSITDPPATQNP